MGLSLYAVHDVRRDARCGGVVFAEIAVGGVFPDTALEKGGYTLQTTGPGGPGSGLAREEGYQLLGKNGAYSDLTSQLRQRRPPRLAGAGEGGEGEGESNNPPHVNFEGYQIINDLVLSVPAIYGVLANDVDDDGPDPLTALLYDLPEHGTLILNADGSFVYDPHDTYVGDDVFVYRAFDGAAVSEPMSVYLVVNGVDIQFQDGESSPEYEYGWTSLLVQSPIVWVGEQIKLRSKVTGVPVWNMVTGHEWDVDEKAIAWWGKDYSYTLPNGANSFLLITKSEPDGSEETAHAEVFEIPAAMMQARFPHYYYVDAGVKTISLTAQTNSGQVVRNGTILVQRPDADIVSTTPAPHVMKYPSGASEAVSFGDPTPLQYGIKFVPSVLNQTTPSGSIQWVQLVDTRVHATDENGVRWRLELSGILDTDYPYPALIAGTVNAKDTPGQQLIVEDRLADRHDDFQMFLMWKSSTANSMYVPLRKVDWFWEFYASSPDGVAWTLNSTDYSHNPTDQDAPNHPEWSENIREYIDGNGNLKLEQVN